MSLIEDENKFIEGQLELVQEEIEHWDNVRQENDTVRWCFTQHRKEGQNYNGETNELEDWRRENVRDYIRQYPDVFEVGNIIVDALALNVQYHCLYKSCKSTGKYCCSNPMCTAHTRQSKEIMQDAGREYIEKYDNESTTARIRRGDTHTAKLNANAKNGECCVFGEVKSQQNPHDGQEYEFINCGLHEGAYQDDLPLHFTHSIGSSLFPADILLVDDKYFITAGHPRPKEHKITRWWTTADDTICMKHGDIREIPILRHPDFDAMFCDILGRNRLDQIQRDIYGEAGHIKPKVQDGWMHAKERGLEHVEEDCYDCEGSGCPTCDQRGWFSRWE